MAGAKGATMEDSSNSLNLNSECPAFADGCPYADASKGESDNKKLAELTSKCVAFENGCPFKSADDIDDIGKLLAAVPASHLVDCNRMGSVQALKTLMMAIHERSIEVRAAVGSECPVFSTTCPFKTVTSAGSPLVSELEYRTWSVFSQGEEAKLEEDAVKLAKSLKTGTRKSHRAAENVHFVRNFIKGKIDRELYKSMTASLWFVYSALEKQLRDNCDNPVYRRLHFPNELERVQALEEDLEYYYGPGWRESIGAPTPCTKEYVDRINAVGAEFPEGLLAHAYTRYLGDLSGGQALMRVAGKALGLPKAGAGTAFYRFPLIPSARKFKKQYRTLLDETCVSVELADKIVAEANLAFVMNMRVFEELDVRAGDSDEVRSLAQVLETLNMPVREGEKCPFAVFGGTFNPHGTPDGPARGNGMAVAATKGECPWPFILLHDPIKGFSNPLTWLLVALIAAIVAFASQMQHA